MKRKKGFTIAEVVIAVAILSIASVAAVSIILSGQRIQRDSRDQFLAANLCENSCMAFCAAADSYKGTDAKELYNEFQKLMNGALGYAPGDLTEAEENGKTVYTASLSFDSSWTPSEEGNYVCMFTFKPDGKTVTFDAEARGKSGGLCSLSFEAYLGGNG